jgi:hypothetical protein
VPADPTDDVSSTILNHRSRRRWTGKGMSLPQLSSVLYAGHGLSDGAPKPSVSQNHAVRLNLVAHNVDQLAPGAYAYKPAGHQLCLIAAGAMRQPVYEMSLMQEVARDALPVRRAWPSW